FFLYDGYALHLHLPSFPTRRSSDLVDRVGADAGKRRPDLAERVGEGLAPLRFGRETSVGAGNAAQEALRRRAGERIGRRRRAQRSEEHTSELQSRGHLVCRLLLEKK